MKILKLMSATRKRFGYVASFKVFIKRILEKFFEIKGVEFVHLPLKDTNFSNEIPERFSLRFLTEEEVQKFAKDPEYDLNGATKNRVASGRDYCFAALADGQLTAYSWYAIGDIEGEHNFGIPMSFSSEFAYMYKGFTHPDFRGNRLHGILMELALKQLHEMHGVNSLISTIEWINFASLASCKKLGYLRLGKIWIVGKGGRILKRPASLKKIDVQLGCHVNSHIKQNQLARN